MPSNLINKVVVGNEVVLDLDSDTLSSADQIPSGVTAHLNTGEAVEGTAEIKETTTYNIETRDETIAVEGEGGGSAYIPAGESINIGISAAERAKIIPDNIAENIVILGVTGTHSGGGSTWGEHPSVNGTSMFGALSSATPTATDYILDPSVRYIANYAFYNKSNIERITMQNNLWGVGNYAFYNCAGLTNLNFLPQTGTMHELGNYAFASCTNLTDATLARATELGSYCFNACSSLESVSFPLCQFIADHAFYNCSALSSVNLGTLCDDIGNYAFYGCINLKDITLPSSCDGVGSYAFSNTGLTSFYGPGVTYYATSLFSNSGFVNFDNQSFMPNARPGTATNVFQSCSALTTADLTGLAIGSTTSASTNASWFSGCSHLTTVNIPNAIAIPQLFFQTCTQLDDVYVPNGCPIWTSTTKAPVFAHGGTFIQAQTYSTSNIRIYVNTSTTVAATMTTASPTVTMTIGDTTYTLTKVANSRFTISW